MGVRGAQTAGPGVTRVLTLDSLARLDRARRTSSRLPLPDGMTVPLGCDAVAAPARYGPLVLPRLPRLGCVYADRADWWWIVPSDSDVALEWPAPARYARGALVPDAESVPELIRRAAGSVPYTPPIPLYLALCGVTGTTPAWARPISA
ncbi:hypothetical protein [Streptomyces sp. Ru72]|uniref:hypothetical protein n=1 Tax=Streptomyces sp. Ru72 TaxID=2080747 RepID=UPI000CDD4E30|nr:hypothetical protein [Streptomyces sp. Ru72]POX50745.1 hypothetical protein C3488_13440 [Streptomyces sp. Ru72]